LPFPPLFPGRGSIFATSGDCPNWTRKRGFPPVAAEWRSASSRELGSLFPRRAETPFFMVKSSCREQPENLPEQDPKQPRRSAERDYDFFAQAGQDAELCMSRALS
jgi:hypothetical protein